MNLLILGLGTGEIILLSIIIILVFVMFIIGKITGERKAYKEILNSNVDPKTKEINRLKKLLNDGMITHEEFNSLRDRLEK